MSCNLFGGRAIQRKLRLLHPLIGPENICASDSDLDSDLEVIHAKVIIRSSIVLYTLIDSSFDNQRNLRSA